MSGQTIDLDIPHDAAERIAREDAYNRRFRERIVEVLRKYGIALEDAPLSALAMAMARMRPPPPQPEAERTMKTSPEALRRHANIVGSADDPGTATALRWAADDIESLHAALYEADMEIVGLQSALASLRPSVAEIERDEAIARSRAETKVEDLLDALEAVRSHYREPHCMEALVPVINAAIAKAKADR